MPIAKGATNHIPSGKKIPETTRKLIDMQAISPQMDNMKNSRFKLKYGELSNAFNLYFLKEYGLNDAVHYSE
jgi:hypothetical protein